MYQKIGIEFIAIITLLVALEEYSVVVYEGVSDET